RLARPPPRLARLEKLRRRQAQPLDRRVDSRPLLRQESPALSLEEGAARARLEEHAPSPSGLDQVLVNQLLVPLENREGIDAVLRRDASDGGERIPVLEDAVEDQRDDTIPELSVNRLAVVPISIHPI